MRELIDWFTGGSYYDYLTWQQSMNYDYPWIVTVMVLCASLFLAYTIIAYRLYAAFYSFKPSKTKSSGISLVLIFFLSSLVNLHCVAKVFWPGYRLYAIVLAILSVYSWRYAIGLSRMDAMFDEIRQAGTVAMAMEQGQETVHKFSDQITNISYALDELSKAVIEGSKNVEYEETRLKLNEIKTHLGTLENVVNKARKIPTS